MTDIRTDPEAGASEAPAKDGETGFGAAFSERATGTPADAPEGKGDEAKSDAAPASDSQEPGKEPDSAAPSSKEAAEGPSGTANADPWEGLPPELKARVERLQASERSQRGRVGALAKKLQRYESSASPAAVASGDRPAGESGTSGKEAGGGDDGTGAARAGDRAAALEDKLAGVVKDFPELAVLQEVVGEVRREIDGIKATAEKVETDLDAKEMTAAYATLEQAHPDYATLAADENFLAWVGDQPDSVIALANSWNPKEVSLVFTLFKAERQAAQAEASGDGENAGDGVKNNDATDARRKRQLEGSRDAAGRGASAAAGVPDDFGSAFKARSAAAAAAK